MKLLKIICTTNVVLFPYFAHAAVTTVCNPTDYSPMDYCMTSGRPNGDYEFAIAQNCKTKKYHSYTGKNGMVCVPYCTTCGAGYKLTTDTCSMSTGKCDIIGSVLQLNELDHLCGTLIVPTCVADTDAECPEGTYGTSPNCKTCPTFASCPGGNGSIFYCNKGYYKDDTRCTRCPKYDNVYGTTSGSGATAVTQCYIASGVELSDETGTFTYTSNCYYSL